MISFNKMKRILDRDDSVKFSGGLFYNDKKAYGIKGARGTNVARDYYYNMENKIVKVSDKNFIRDLLYKKYADHDLMDGKFCHNGVIYDGGEFARQECLKYEEEKMKKRWESHRDNVFGTHNHIAEEVAKGILKNSVVRITKEAKEKAHKIAKRMVRLTGPNEIYMEGVNFRDREENDLAIRDIYISDGQTATPSNCGRMSSEDIMLTKGKLADKDQYKVAWIHSHANMFPSHSSTDDRNLESLTLKDGREINFPIDARGYVSWTKLKIHPSLIFNAKGSNPYVEIGGEYWAPGRIGNESRIKYFSKKNAPLVVINEQNGIDLSTRTIDREIMERVTWPGKRSSRNLEETLEQQPVSFMNLSKKTSESVKKEEKYAPVFFEKIETESQPKKSLIKRMFNLENIQNKLIEAYNKLIEDYNLFKKEVSLTQ